MEGYEAFKERIYKLMVIDLSSYKERQMKRRIESLITRNHMNKLISPLVHDIEPGGYLCGGLSKVHKIRYNVT